MPRTMTPERKRAMAAGRARYQAEQAERALARVAAFRQWLKAGSPLRSIPEIPTDADYARTRTTP